ncbi:retrovirus-related Pol polyprotein from transposon 17.6, partial [Trichonephila inaurata madagascariensis]
DNPTPLAYADPTRHSYRRMAMSQTLILLLVVQSNQTS